MNLKQIVQWMLENGYMAKVKDKYRITAKFNKEMTGKEVGLVMINNQPLVMENPPPPISTAQTAGLLKTDPQIDWTNAYLQFIRDAQVPARCDGGDGAYDINKYSDEGMKAFRKAMKEGIMYEILVKSTMLYYKTHKRYALTIGRYIGDNVWRSDYIALLQSAKEGKVEEHIKQEIKKDNEFSRFKPTGL